MFQVTRLFYQSEGIISAQYSYAMQKIVYNFSSCLALAQC